MPTPPPFFPACDRVALDRYRTAIRDEGRRLLSEYHAAVEREDIEVPLLRAGLKRFAWENEEVASRLEIGIALLEAAS
mgnify:CR=1 FL=1